MGGLTLLAEARQAGLTVRVEGDRLLIRGPREQEALAKRLLSQKAELLGLFREAPPWDQAEADRLLDQLRRELARLEHTWPGGKLPPDRQNVVQIGVEECEYYVRNHQLEAACGWNPLALLRDALPGVLRLATPPIPNGTTT
jgi:hypothetical protein